MYILYLIRLLNISESLHTHPIKSSTAKYSSESGVIPEKAGISFSSFLSSLGDAKHSQKKKSSANATTSHDLTSPKTRGVEPVLPSYPHYAYSLYHHKVIPFTPGLLHSSFIFKIFFSIYLCYILRKHADELAMHVGELLQ